MHGLPLTEQVIDAVRRDPAASALPYLLPYVNVPWVEGGVANPMAEELLADATFPSGRPLPPSLRAWLAYDISLLERHKWFTPDGDFAPRPLDQLVGDEMGDFWGAEFAWLSGRFSECFLLPGGSDSRRILAVTDPDDEGEYPVFALDLDDLPYLGLMYPGFDVYLADTAGLPVGPGRTGDLYGSDPPRNLRAPDAPPRRAVFRGGVLRAVPLRVRTRVQAARSRTGSGRHPERDRDRPILTRPSLIRMSPAGSAVVAAR